MSLLILQLPVTDNVCYNTFVYAYFLENGREKDTAFNGNLVASVKAGSLLPSDKLVL